MIWSNNKATTRTNSTHFQLSNLDLLFPVGELSLVVGPGELLILSDLRAWLTPNLNHNLQSWKWEINIATESSLRNEIYFRESASSFPNYQGRTPGPGPKYSHQHHSLRFPVSLACQCNHQGEHHIWVPVQRESLPRCCRCLCTWARPPATPTWRCVRGW